MTVACIVVLWATGVTPFDALIHALAAVSTGGFSSHRDGLVGLGGTATQAAVIAFAVAGSPSLPLYWQLRRRRRLKAFFGDPQLWVLLGCGLTVALAIAVLLIVRQQVAWPDAMKQALLGTFSAQSTAGFVTGNISDMDAGIKLLTIVSMVVGGSSESTAGGIKVIRLLVLLRLLHATLFRTTLPKHAVYAPALAGRRLETEQELAALLIIALFAIVTAISWLPFVLMGYDPLDSLFEVVAATATAGLSTGISSPELPTALKGLLCLDMLMGRLEFVALLVLFYPRTWFAKGMKTP